MFLEGLLEKVSLPMTVIRMTATEIRARTALKKQSPTPAILLLDCLASALPVREQNKLVWRGSI